MKLKFLLRLLLSVGLLLFLIIKIDFRKIIELLITMDVKMLVLFLIPFPASIFLNAINIRYLLNEKIKFKLLLKLRLICRSSALFFPGQVGELFFIPLLKTNGVPMGKSSASVTINKIISLILSISLASYGFLIFFGQATFWKALILFLLFLVTIIFITTSATSRNFLKKYFLKKYSSLFTGYNQHLKEVWKNRKEVILLNYLILITILLINATIIKLLLDSFGYNLNLIIILSIQSIGALSSLIPISISGLGVRESLVVYLYQLMEVNPVVILSILLGFLFVSYLISALTLIIVAKDFKLGSLKEIIKNEKIEANK